MAITGIHHVVFRVKDLDAAIESYEKLGFTLTRRLETPGIGKQAILDLAGDTFVELVAPTSPDSDVGRAIEKRGEGVHSIAFSADDYETSVQDIKDSGARVIEFPEVPTSVFIHPKDTHGVLMQVQVG